MPIKIDNSTFEDFDKAVEHVMKTKGLSKDKASAYVGTVDRNENKSAKTITQLLSQLKLARIKLKLADTYDDDNSPDNYQYDTGKVIKKAKDNGEFNLKYDQKELRLGVLYELRFTYNQEEAREKAKKNLNKDSQYYSKMWRDETLVDLTAFDPKRFEQQGSKLSIAGGMRLASQNGKYAKYWILNAKDVNGNGWGVSPTTIRQNMASFINKPFVITAKTWIANSEYENQFDHPYISSTDMNQVLNYQEKFRVGNIDNILEDDKNDFYAMISIDDAYRHLPLPPFCSPAIYQQDLSEPEGDITKWGGLHLAGLMENPAYGPRVAILRGSCVGTPNSCLTQFKNQ